MTIKSTLKGSEYRVPRGSSQRRHWWRWIFVGILAIIVLITGIAAIYVKAQTVPAPLALPKAASAPAGPLDGTWSAASGSLAGFRLQQTIIGMSSSVVGRTDAVTGRLVISGDQVTGATFRMDLNTVKVGGKAQPQFTKSLDTQAYPTATFTLTRPVVLNSAIDSNAAIHTTAAGDLVIRGVSHPVTATVEGHRDGPGIDITGSIPITFSDWGIEGPRNFGPFASLADKGVAEFLLILHRQ